MNQLIKLPRGIFFDPKRRRYRVRVHIKSKVIHLSYHRTYEEALEAFKEAKHQQFEVRRMPPPDTSTPQGMIDALVNNRL